jgi:hypothetical protein
MIQLSKSNKKYFILTGEKSFLSCYNYIFFFSLDGMSGLAVNRFRIFCKSKNLYILSSINLKFFSYFVNFPFFNFCKFICFCSNSLDFVQELLNIDFVLNKSFLFLFFFRFLNVFALKDIFLLSKKYTCNYLFFFCHISLVFCLFFFKLIYWLNNVINKII